MTLRRGRIASKKEIGPIRELTRADLETLKAPRPKGETVAKLFDSHHRIARLFAMGLRKHDVHQKSGYSLGRLTQLLGSPAFTNLVESYRKMVDDSWRQEVDEFYELANKNKIVAERMIADRLERAEDDIDEVPLKTLIAIVADRADRTGHGKKSTTLNVNVDLGSRLERARSRAARVTIDGQATYPAAHQAPQLITVTPVSVPLAAEPPIKRRQIA